MAPTYKLIHFPVKVMGEAIRFLFSYGKIDFEDFRFELDEWPNYKPLMPFGQTPVLEFKGIQGFQTNAICRYLAKQVDLAGASDLEDLEIDAIVDTIADFRNNLNNHKKYSDISEKHKQLMPEEVSYYLPRFEAVAKTNNGYLALGKLTWADIYFVALIDFLDFLLDKKAIEDYPTLLSLEEKVLNLPGIKEWVAKRPFTDK